MLWINHYPQIRKFAYQYDLYIKKSSKKFIFKNLLKRTNIDNDSIYFDN